jgi:uncharacterized protein with FMN-binding domain
MTDRNFSRKLHYLVLVLLILAVYQTTIYVHGKDEKINQLEVELTAYRQTAKTTETSVEESNNAAIWRDGTYTGSAQGFGGPVVVELTITDGQIRSLEVVEAQGEDSAYLNSAMKITDEIVEKQDTEVDSVSGATFSSKGICDAAASALEQAVIQ